MVSDDSPTSRQLQQLISSELRLTGLTEVPFGGSAQSLKAGGENADGAADFTVVVGAPALRKLLQQGAPRQVIVVLITRGALEEELSRALPRGGREIHAIVLDQPLGRYLDLIQLALPQRSRVGLLLGTGGGSQQKTLEKLASVRDMNISVARVFGDAVFITQLERLLTQCDVLLALPDSSIHNRNTVQPLLLTTYRAGVPVVAYSEGYAQAGALLALYSTPSQLARQTAEVLQHLAQGRNVPQVQMPRYFSVSVNASVARSLGLALPSGDILRERLLQSSKASE